MFLQTEGRHCFETRSAVSTAAAAHRGSMVTPAGEEQTSCHMGANSNGGEQRVNVDARHTLFLNRGKTRSIYLLKQITPTAHC